MHNNDFEKHLNELRATLWEEVPTLARYSQVIVLVLAFYAVVTAQLDRELVVVLAFLEVIGAECLIAMLKGGE